MHGDLAPQNIIVQEGKIVAIIDWETAGWFPEYWEYTQAWESAWRWQEWRTRLGEFLDVYEAELDIEQMRIGITS
jgi:aminoglycoside phosphotransferase (APT) family kinase protein